MAGRQRQVQRLPGAVAPAFPLVRCGAAAQVARRGAGLGLAPGAGRPWPPARLVVATLLDKGQVVLPAQHLGVDRSRRQVDLVCPQLIVEGKGIVGRAAQGPVASGHADGWAGFGQGPTLPAWVGQRDAQGLGHVDGGLVVHVFMGQAQAVEVQAGGVGMLALKQGQVVGQAIGQALAQGVRVGQRQGPTAGVRHAAGVKQGVGTGPAAGLTRHIRVGGHTAAAVRVARQPPVLKPADVPQLPQRRVEVGPVGHAQALLRQGGFERGKRGQGVAPAVLQRQGQVFGPARPQRAGRQAVS